MRYLLLTVAAALALTGCGGDPEPEPETPEAVASQSPEDAYLAQLSDDVPAYVIGTDQEQWVDHGYEACRTIERGNMDDYEIALAFVSVERMELAHAEAVVLAARDNLCPELY